MFSEKGMKPDPEKIQEIWETPELTNYMKNLHMIIVHKHNICENYYRKITFKIRLDLEGNTWARF